MVKMGSDIEVDSIPDLIPSLSAAVDHKLENGRPVIVQPVIVVGFVVSLIIYLVFHQKNNKSTLPGPRGVPLLGSIPALCRNPINKLKEYTEKYGPIYQIKMGPTSAVVLNSIETVREAYMTKSSVFNNRPKLFASLVGLESLGIVLLQPGPFHSEQKHMLSRVLKNIGTDAYDRYIPTHLTKLKHTLRDSTDSAINIIPLISETIFATVGQFIFGANTDVSHLKHLVEGNLSANPMIVLSGKFIPEWLKKKITKYVDLSTNLEMSLKRILNEIQEQKHIFKSGNFKDLISGFLHTYEAMLLDHQMAEKSGSAFVDEMSTSDKQLASVMMDCYQAGVEATSAQAKWTFYYLAKNPHVQVKIQEEMDRVIGRDKTPLITHKRHHTYTLATMQEVMRLRPAAPLGAPHANNAPETLCGHKIPEETLILTNIWAIHMDPNHWDSPEEFRPERFLDDDGNVKRPASFIPFSIGRRLCPGDQIARNMIFLLVTNILQHFSFTIAEDQSSDCGSQGINWLPNDFKVMVIPRERSTDPEQ